MLWCPCLRAGCLAFLRSGASSTALLNTARVPGDLRHAIYMVVGCASLALMRAARCPLAYGLRSDCSQSARGSAFRALQRGSLARARAICDTQRESRARSEQQVTSSAGRSASATSTPHARDGEPSPARRRPAPRCARRGMPSMLLREDIARFSRRALLARRSRPGGGPARRRRSAARTPRRC